MRSSCFSTEQQTRNLSHNATPKQDYTADPWKCQGKDFHNAVGTREHTAAQQPQIWMVTLSTVSEITAHTHTYRPLADATYFSGRQLRARNCWRLKHCGHCTGHYLILYWWGGGEIKTAATHRPLASETIERGTESKWMYLFRDLTGLSNSTTPSNHLYYIQLWVVPTGLLKDTNNMGIWTAKARLWCQSQSRLR